MNVLQYEMLRNKSGTVKNTKHRVAF